MTRPPVPPRPDDGCLLCRCHWTGTQWRWPRAEPNYRTCQPCADRLSTDLRAVRDEYARLTPERPVLGSRTRAAGFASRSPANDLAIALTDRRNPEAIEPGDVPDVLGEMHEWAQEVREKAELYPLEGHATMTTESGVLLGQIPWITRQTWVDKFATDVSSWLGAIRAGNGETEGRVRLGPCPDCGAQLYVRPTAEVVHCSCGARWPRPQWEMLGKAMRTS